MTLNSADIKQMIETRRRTVEIPQITPPNPNNPKTPNVRPTVFEESQDDPHWNVPLPLNEPSAPSRSYPIEVLPHALREAIKEVQNFVQSPIPLVANSAIVCLSTASQAHLDVARDGNLIGPTSIFALTIAESGERKTSSDKHFSDPIREFETEELIRLGPDIARYKADFASWQAKIDGTEAAIRSLAQKPSKLSDANKLESSLQELHANEPLRPKIPRYIRADDTPENLAFALTKEHPSAGIISSEGGLILGSRAFGKESATSALAGYNALWDGMSWHIGRKASDSFTVRGARLSLGIQVQPEVLQAFQASNQARGIGFFARCLITFPDSTQGSRTYKPAPEKMAKLTEFNQLIKQLLSIEPKTQNGQLTPGVIGLSPEARNVWIDFHDRIENQLKQGGRLASIRDIASKIAENAARLAAQFSVVQGFPVVAVERHLMESGCLIAEWHLDEALRYFGSLNPSQLPTLAKAQRFEKWALARCKNEQTSVLERTVCMQNLPKDIGNADSLGEIIGFLAAKNRARFIDDGRRIAINPALLTCGG